jgi:hypothetical protein
MGFYLININFTLMDTKKQSWFLVSFLLYVLLLYIYHILQHLRDRNTFYRVMGFSYIFYIIYIRIILKRLPNTLPENLSILGIMFYACILLILIAGMIFTLRSILVYFNMLKISNNNLLLKKFKYFFDYFQKSLLFVHHFFLEELSKFFSVANFLTRIIQYLYKRYSYETMLAHSFKFFIFFYYMPISIYLFTFIIDVFFFGSFCYIYKLMPLMLVPLLFKYFLFIFQDLAETNIKYMSENIIYFTWRKNVKIEQKSPQGKISIDYGPKVSTEEHLSFCQTSNNIPEAYLNMFHVSIYKKYLKKNTINTDKEQLTLFLFDNFCFFMKLNQHLYIFHCFENSLYKLLFVFLRYLLLFITFGYILYNGL